MAEALRLVRRASSPIFILAFLLPAGAVEARRGACSAVAAAKAAASCRTPKRPPQNAAATESPERALDLKLTSRFSIWGWDVANPIWRKAMKSRKKLFGQGSKRSAVVMASAALTLLMAGGETSGLIAQNSPAFVIEEKQVATTQSKFYCNIKALNPEERAHHKQLSEKLMAARKKIVETDKGYEFQYSSADVSLAELAEWVGAESKCCPFFDFHIDVEREGKLLCLRLTGEEGIKAFIRAEFKLEKTK